MFKLVLEKAEEPEINGILQQEYWRGLPCSPPGDLPNPGIELVSLLSPALAGRIFSTSATWEARVAILAPLYLL